VEHFDTNVEFSVALKFSRDVFTAFVEAGDTSAESGLGQVLAAVRH